jgi:hypothetical protein
MGARLSRRAAWPILGLLLLGALLAGCSSSASGSSGSGSSGSGPSSGGGLGVGASNPGPPAAQAEGVLSQQLLNNERLTANMRALQRGVLTYRAPGAMKTGQQGVFLSATVKDLGDNPIATTTYSSTPGQVTYQHNAPTGGYVAVKATCVGYLTCQLVTSLELPLTELGQSGTWTWALSATDPAIAHIYLVEYVYNVNTKTPLSQTNYPIDISIVVRGAPQQVPATTPPSAQSSHDSSNFLSFLGDAEQQVFIFASILAAIVGVVPEARKPLVATAKKLVRKGGDQTAPPGADGGPQGSADSV